MVNEYKNIVLLKGLEGMEDYHFRTIKSLLRKELNLTKTMQDNYDRIQLADLMEDKFPKEAGLNKLINACELIDELKDLAKKLKTEKAKVQKQKKGNGKTPMKKRKQDELSTSEFLPISIESNKNKPSSKKMTKQITKTGGGKKKKLTQERAQLPEPSGPDIKREEDCLQTPQKPPLTPPSNSSNKKTTSVGIEKKKRKQITKTEGGKKKKLTQEQALLPEPSGPDIKKEEDCLQTPQKPPLTLPSNSSNKKKTKQITKTEGEKKEKLTEEYAQLPEPSGPDIKKEEDCLQTPQKPPLTPPSNSSNKNQKNTIIQKHSIKTEHPQEKHQSVEFSTTSNFPAVSKVMTFEGLSTIASSSLPSPQKPPEAQLDLKMSPGSPSPCQNFPASVVSDSSLHLNSNIPSALFSGAQVLYVPSASAVSNAGLPLLPSVTVPCSSSAPQMSPITVPSSIQNLHLFTPAVFNSTVSPHSPAAASRNVQTTRVPSATLTSKAQVIKMPPPVTAASNAQVPHTLASMSRNISITQAPQTTTSNSIQTLNSATVKASKNVQAPQVSLPTEPNYFQASLAPPSATPSSLTAPQVSMSTATSRSQNTQIHSGTGSISVQALHAPPAVSRSVCPAQLMQGSASSTGKTLLPKVEASRKVQAPWVSSATASSSLPTPQLSPATASRALHATPGPLATEHSSPSGTPRRQTVPKEPAREEGHHQGPKQVMVLKVTESFTYDMKEDKKMFHATVATETEFFRVKVFDTALKSKFIPRKIIAISDYFGCNGFLEIHRTSCVSDVNVNQTMVIPDTLRKRANATPKISYLFSQTRGTFVNGEFVVIQKTERNKFIYYGIEDDTGKMEVVVYGRLTNIKCEPGNKLRLFCFELNSTEDSWQLRSVRHSYMQVISPRM